MEGKNLLVTLRVHKGKVSYDKNGKLQSDNQVVVLIHGSGAWTNYLAHARLNHTGMEVEKVVEETMKSIDTGRTNAQGFKITRPEFTENPIDTPKEITAEVLKAISPPVAELSPEQKELAELRAIVEDLKEGKDETPNVNEELEAARKELEGLTGKKPSHLFKLESLQTKIAEARAAKE
jgi:hypothetical protein